MAALGLGIACMVAALMFTELRDRHALSSRGLRTEAVVVRIDHEDHRHGWFESRRTYYPVFAFATAQGQDIEVRSRKRAYPPLPVEGQLVLVVHDPAEPSLVRDAAAFDADYRWHPWVWAPFLALGLVLCVMAVARPGWLRRP